jgi:hypothetical protein
VILLSYILSIETLSEFFLIKSKIDFSLDTIKFEQIFTKETAKRAFNSLLDNLERIETSSFTLTEAEDLEKRNVLLAKLDKKYNYTEEPEFLHLFSILNYKIKERNVIKCAIKYVKKLIHEVLT